MNNATILAVKCWQWIRCLFGKHYLIKHPDMLKMRCVACGKIQPLPWYETEGGVAAFREAFRGEVVKTYETKER